MASVSIGEHNIVSPLGFTSEENFEAVLSGKTGLSKTKMSFSDTPFCVSKIEEKELFQVAGKKFPNAELTRLESMMALSIADVLERSGLDLKDEKNLLILSTTKGNIDIVDGSSAFKGKNREYLPSIAAVLGKLFSCKNEPLIVSNACISGLLAMIIAQRMIASGQYKNIVVCGGDLVSEFTLSGFKSFNALSEEPCKPFDKNRKGINLGEAATTIVLSAEKRSDISLVAGASANDANHISGPSRTGQGLFQCIESVLQNGKYKPDFINAHGTATEFNDEMEAVAFSRSGLAEVPVNSLKGIYGHTLGAAGILESIISIMALQKNTMLHSAGFESIGVSHLNKIQSRDEERPYTTLLKTASGFGGCNAAAIFQKIK